MDRKRRVGNSFKKIFKMVLESPLLYTRLYTIVYKETNVDKIRIVAGCRAISFGNKQEGKKRRR